MSTQFDYDVFLSHSSKDKPVVRELANRLRKDGLRVWLDEWEIQPGDMIGLKIQQGLERSRTLLMVMSAAYFASEWSTLEHQTLLFRDPTNAQRRFILLLISYLHMRKSDDEEIFTIKNSRHAEYWQAHEYPVMLVIRTSDSQIRWMNVTDYLMRHGKGTRQIVFDGESFTALNVARMRERVVGRE